MDGRTDRRFDKGSDCLASPRLPSLHCHANNQIGQIALGPKCCCGVATLAPSPLSLARIKVVERLVLNFSQIF